MATEKNSKPQLRRISLWIFVTGIILLACMYILRSVLIAPVAIAIAEHTIAENLGLQITIGNLGGTYFSDLELQNIKTVKRLSEGPLSDVQLRRLTVAYRLTDVLKGLSVFLAGAAIELEGARLSVDLTGETDSAEEEKPPDGFRLPPNLPQVRIQDSSLEIKGSGYVTRFNGISLSAGFSQPAGTRLQLHAAHWSLNQPALMPIAAELHAELLYSPDNSWSTTRS